MDGVASFGFRQRPHWECPPADRGPWTRVPRGEHRRSFSRSCSPGGQRTAETPDDRDGPRSTSPDLEPSRARQPQPAGRPRAREVVRADVQRSWDSESVPSLPLLAPWRPCAHPRRSIAVGGVAWEHHATRLPGGAVSQRARPVEQPAQRRRAVLLASVTWPPTSPRRRTPGGLRASVRRPRAPRTRPDTLVGASSFGPSARGR